MGKKQYYAVARGRRPGIYTTWSGAGGAEEQVKGFQGATFRGFASYEEAVNWLEERATGRGKIEDHEPKTTYRAPSPLKEERGARQSQGAQRGTREDDEAVVIYTDGSSRGNPGPGGWAAIIMDHGLRRELSGGFRRTTNNRMELLACIHALESLEERRGVTLHSDSSYVVNGVERGWAKRWRANGWMRTRDAPAENADLWARLLDQLDRHAVRFVWLRGHSGHPENERCDRLAVTAASAPDLPPDPGFKRLI